MSGRYDLLALDLDGTLLDPRGRLSERNVQAVRRARAAGMRVVVCTGRGLAECATYLSALEQIDPVGVAGGSIVACPVRGRTLHRFTLDPDMVRRAACRLLDHGHAVMVLKDPAAAGYDYLMVVGEAGRHQPDPITRWWFEQMPVQVRYVERIEDDPHPEHTVRVGVCGRACALAQITRDLIESFGQQATIHQFQAVVPPELNGRRDDPAGVHILEVFSPEGNKWSAVQWVARQMGVPVARICAIGDEINDVAMIAGAGLGIAMGNAAEAVRRVARQQTLDNGHDGVAHAIEQVLTGAW